MSRHVQDSSLRPLDLLEIEIKRNAFGRQIDSFCAPIEAQLSCSCRILWRAYFIRAPRIRSCGETVHVLARYQNEPVLVQQGHHLGSSFHPELTKDSSIHQHFLDLVRQCNVKRKK